MTDPIQAIFGISSGAASELLGTLTERELQIAGLMANGLKNETIAKQLGISAGTVELHRGNLKRKLGAETNVQVARVIFAEKFGEHLG